MAAPLSAPQRATGDAVRITGEAHALFAFDVGFQIDLDAAAALVQDPSRRRVMRARRPAPIWFDYAPPPLRLALDGEAVRITEHAQASPIAEALIYDFGAILLTYRLPLPATLDDLPALSAALHTDETLRADATARARRLMDSIRAAIERPRFGEAVEDYAVFSITGWDGQHPPAVLLDRHRDSIAQAIEGERTALSAEQRDQSTSGAIAYTPEDLAIIDWNAAILFDAQPEDVLAVLQHANVELLELRVLDQELDEILDRADETLARLLRRRLWPALEERRLLGRVAAAQTDAAVMFEGVNNAIKLLGNQYLARLYRLSARRLDLPAWQASVQRKLEATEGLYQKMSDAASTRRLETLEWVIIILIAVSILLPFTPLYG